MGLPKNGRDGTCVDDAAEFVWQHQAGRIAGETEAGREIDVDDAVKVIILPFDQGPAMLNARIVDQYI